MIPIAENSRTRTYEYFASEYESKCSKHFEAFPNEWAR